jgi:hypothetical protein
VSALLLVLVLALQPAIGAPAGAATPTVSTQPPAGRPGTTPVAGPATPNTAGAPKHHGNSRGEEQREIENRALVLAFALLFAPAVLAVWLDRGPKPRGFRRLYVGEDNRVSTSKLVPFLWTFALAFGLLSLILADIFGASQGFDALVKAGTQEQYYVLLGGPFAAAVAAKGITTKKTAEPNNSFEKPPDHDGPSLSQAVTDDRGNVDLGDFQYVLFTALGLVYFLGRFLAHVDHGLPSMPDVLVGLITISAAGYVGKKSTERGTPIVTGVEPLPIVLARGGTYTVVGRGFIAGRENAPTNANAVDLDGRPVNATRWAATQVTVELPPATVEERRNAGFNTSDHSGELVVRNDQGLASAPFPVDVRT